MTRILNPMAQRACLALIACFCVAGSAKGQILPQVAPTELIVETPPLAAVFLDGTHLGDAPLNGVLLIHGPKPGSHELRVTSGDAEPFTRKIVVVANKTTRIRAELTPYTGDLEILTTPGAEVLVDGKPAGAADSAGRLLVPGLILRDHTLLVRKAGYNLEEQKARPAIGLPTTITIELKAIEATGEGDAGSPPEYAPERRLTVRGQTRIDLFFLRDNDRLVSVQDGDIIQWDPAGGRQLSATRLDADLGINAVSPDLKWAAVRYLDNGERTKLVEIATGRILWKWPGYASEFTSDSKRLIVDPEVNSDDVVAWDVESGKVAQTWHHVMGGITFDGKRAAIGGKSPAIVDTETGRVLQTLSATECCGGGLFSPDGRWLAVRVSEGKKIELWEVATGARGRTIEAANGSEPNIKFEKMLFTPESRYLITLDQNALRVWDRFSGREVRKLTRPPGISGITLSPDGRWLAAAGDQITLLRRKE